MKSVFRNIQPGALYHFGEEFNILWEPDGKNKKIILKLIRFDAYNLNGIVVWNITPCGVGIDDSGHYKWKIDTIECPGITRPIYTSNYRLDIHYFENEEAYSGNHTSPIFAIINCPKEKN